MGAEATLQKTIVNAARKRGAYVEKNDQTGRGRRGTPDLSMCYRGHWLSVEVKDPDGTTAKARRIQQSARIYEVRDAGGIAFIATDLRQVVDVLNQLDRLVEADNDVRGRRFTAIGKRVIQPHVPRPELVTL